MRESRGQTVPANPDGSLRVRSAPSSEPSAMPSDALPKDKDLVSLLLEKNRCLETQLLHLQRETSFFRLLPGMVHDFNHLLTHIIGYTELSLANISPGGPHLDNLRKVRAAGKKAADLTRKLLSHCSRQEVQLDALDMSGIVASVGRLFERMLGENIRLEFDLEASAGPVWADPLQMEQVLTNLVVNARDAMPMGGRIVLMTRKTALHEGNRLGIPAGAYVVVTVEDSGPGIPPDIRRRIFEPFFTTKERTGGTGLGLSTVDTIVQGCSGHIVLKTAPGKGTRFNIYLPLAGNGASVQGSGTVPSSGRNTRWTDKAPAVGLCGPVRNSACRSVP